jgi:hypothetical protein
MYVEKKEESEKVVLVCEVIWDMMDVSILMLLSY